MIAPGATIAASVRALAAAGATGDVTVVATHAVFLPDSLAKSADAGVRALLVTDSVPPNWSRDAELQPQVVSVAPLLSLAVRRLFQGGSLRELA